MSNLVVVGLNHRTAPLDIRQLAAFNEEQISEGLHTLLRRPCIQEALILSTCNRVEIVVHGEAEAAGESESFLSEWCRIPLEKLQSSLYRHVAENAVRHLFRVAASLDSMILGEPQILGQVKSCYVAAEEARTLGPRLNSLLQAAFKTAKRVRTETSIGEYPVSSSSAAVELARKIFGGLSDKRILIVGAGKMGETAIRQLADAGAKSIHVLNRGLEAARRLADQFGGTAHPFEQLRAVLEITDIVLTSTGAPDILIRSDTVREIMRMRRNLPMVFIDISVPRNVDPTVGEIDNVFCYDIDDLSTVVEANRGERMKAAVAAEKIVDQEMRLFCGKLRSLETIPMVVQVQNRIEAICRSELQRYLKKTGPQSDKQIHELESMMSRVAAKITHPLLIQLRRRPKGADESTLDETALAELLEKLLQNGQAVPQVAHKKGD